MFALYLAYGLQVSVSLSSNETMPGDPVTLRIQGEKGSCVCVAAVDKSLYLLKPDFQLSPDKVGPRVMKIIIYSVMFSSCTGCLIAQLFLYPTWHHICFLPSQIFKELADFDISDAFGIPKDDGHFWWPGLSSRRRRRSSVFPWHWDITKDARFAFTVSTHSTPEPSVASRQQQGRETKQKHVLKLCVLLFLCMSNSGNRADCDDRHGEFKPPAEWRHVH